MARAKRSQPKSKWTLLAVGQDGRTVVVEHFKSILWLLSISLVIVTAVALLLFYHARTVRSQHRKLTGQLAEARQQTVDLRNEVDVLMVRLARKKNDLAQMETPAMPQTETSAPAVAESPPPVPSEPADAPADVPDAPSPLDPPVPSTAEEPTPAQALADTPELPPAPEPAPVEPSVSVENFKALRDLEKSRIGIRFQIQNNAPEKGGIEGRMFVILKDDLQSPTGWICFPEVPLQDGQPALIRRGRYFSIVRFNNIRFKAKFVPEAARYQAATVLVYSEQGTLLLENDYSL